jgi:hypothetical protein
LSLLDEILPLPIKFDENEWFILLTILFGYSWVLFAPKRYPTTISVLVILFCVSAALIIDHSIAGPPFDLYDINDRKKYELFDVITYFMYSPYALLSVYLYDKFDPKGFRFTAYIVGWAILCTFFQWLALKCHVFTYNNWNMSYSFSVYLVLTYFQLSFFRLILRYFNENSHKTARG